MFQRVAEADAVLVAARQTVFQLEDFGEHPEAIITGAK